MAAGCGLSIYVSLTISLSLSLSLSLPLALSRSPAPQPTARAPTRRVKCSNASVDLIRQELQSKSFVAMKFTSRFLKIFLAKNMLCSQLHRQKKT